VNNLNSREMIINTYYYENDNYIGNYKNYHSQISSSSLEHLCHSNIKTKLEIFKNILQYLHRISKVNVQNQKKLMILILKLVVIIN
jgi:hypothetical protein